MKVSKFTKDDERELAILLNNKFKPLTAHDHKGRVNQVSFILYQKCQEGRIGYKAIIYESSHFTLTWLKKAAETIKKLEKQK